MVDPNDRAVLLPNVGSGWSFDDMGAGKIIYSYTGTELTPFDWSEVKVGMYIPTKNGNLAKIQRKVKVVDGTTTKYEFQVHRDVEKERPGHALKRYEESTEL